MKKLMIAAVIAVCAAETFAMPTKAELTKAQPLVVELMAPAMAKYKSAPYKEKAKAAAKVGDASSEFAKAAETEAAKFLLLKGAVNFYTRGEQYDKAADTVAELQRAVKDVPPAVIAEITGKATSRISEAKAPRLYAVYRTAKLQVRASDEAKALKAKLKKAKSDALQRKYAEALAVSGDWKAAYAEFAKVSDAKLKEIVAAEAEGNAKSAESGEFWWAYEPTFEEADDFFKSHAAAYYRKALDAGEITGLKKNLVEQRLKQVEVAAAPVAASEKTEKTVDESPDKIAVKVAEQGKGMKLKIKNGVEIEFVQCPAGSFMMGKAGDDDANSCTRCHKVNITRPFWMSKTQVTCAQWEAFEKPRATAMYQKGADRSDIPVSFVTHDQATEYCGHLNRRFKEQLPRGCVIRLPTEAEWEYALTAGTDDFDNPYIRFRDGSFAEKEEVIPKIAATRADMEREIIPIAADWCKKKFAAKEDTSTWLRCRVAKKLPNNWGLYDMLSNGAEITLDTVWQLGAKCKGKIVPISWWGRQMCYAAEETDPLRMNEQPKRSACCVVRGVRQGGHAFTPDWHHRDGVPTDVEYNGQTFRIVIGPDLVSEWKAKHGKK